MSKLMLRQTMTTMTLTGRKVDEKNHLVNMNVMAYSDLQRQALYYTMTSNYLHKTGVRCSLYYCLCMLLWLVMRPWYERRFSVDF